MSIDDSQKPDGAPAKRKTLPPSFVVNKEFLHAAWLESREYRDFKIIAATLTAIPFLAAFLAFVTHKLSASETWPTVGPYTVDPLHVGLALAIAGLVVGRFAHRYLREMHRSRYVRASLSVELKIAEANLADNLDLSSLWKANTKRLDYYHEIVTGQAEKSFRNGQFAMLTGFIILCASVVVAITSKSTTKTITAGALGAVGTALSAYIGRTFIRSQESSSQHLRSYFMHPLSLSRFLLAERVIAQLDGESRTEPSREMVTSILNDDLTSQLLAHGLADQQSLRPKTKD